MKIPDYYRQFQNQPAAKEEENKQAEQPQPQQKKEQQTSQQPPQQPKKVEDKTRLYTADCFTINMLEDWQDKTIYTLTGPVTDGIQHNVIINVDPDLPFENLIDYADWQIKTLEDELKSCTLLKRGEIKMDNGTDAYEAIFSWFPLDDVRIYQHQIFVLVDKTAYKLTASFTKKTRQTMGPQVLRMMLSFNINIGNKKS